MTKSNTLSIIDELAERKESDHYNRFNPRTIVAQNENHNINLRGCFQGVETVYEDNFGNLRRRQLLPTIFDSVVLTKGAGYKIAIASVDNKKGVWILKNNEIFQALTIDWDEILTDVRYSGIVFRGESGEGLYDGITRREIYPANNLAVSFDTSSKLIWAHKASGEWLYALPGNTPDILYAQEIIPLDHPEFAGYIDADGDFKILSGDSYRIRQLVVEAGGRLALFNSRQPRIFYMNAAGHILNY